jgi:hypothetical protein
MGLLFLLVALLGLVFPPFAVVVLAMLILGVFAKGMADESSEQIVMVRRKARRRQGAERAKDAMRPHAMAPRRGNVIDVRWYPVPPAYDRVLQSSDTVTSASQGIPEVTSGRIPIRR